MKNEAIISLIFRPLSGWRKWLYKKLIQNYPFEYGIKIINFGEKEFMGKEIKNVRIFPLNKNMNFSIDSDKIFPIEKLLYGDSQEIWFDKISIPIEGAFLLSFDMDYVGDKMYSFRNLHFNIVSEESFNQKITNFLLVALTIFMLITSFYSLFF